MNSIYRKQSYPDLVARLRPVAVVTLVAFVWCFVGTPAALAIQSAMPGMQMGVPATRAKVKLPALVLHPAPTEARLPDGHIISLTSAREPGAALPNFDYQAAAAARALHPIQPLVMAKGLPVSLIGSHAEIARPISAAQVASWKAESRSPKTPAPRLAQLHLWLGEIDMDREQDPDTARWHFRMAETLVGQSSPIRGLAAFDNAFCLYKAGAYRDSLNAFEALTAPDSRLSGYSRSAAALSLRHAAACVGYHAERTAAGIPEPNRLDPLCGAAGLAAAMRAMGRPYDKATILRACKVTGYGSSLQDIVAAGPKLGVDIRSVTADDTGLMALPKPCIAYVEHDHFIAVVKASKAGVTYLCSDCGPWPGGQVNLTWKQWHLLNPGSYGVITKPGTPWDRALASVPWGSGTPAYSRLEASLGIIPEERLAEGCAPVTQIASVGDLRGLQDGGQMAAVAAILPVLRGHIARFNWAQYSSCGPGTFTSWLCKVFGFCPHGGGNCNGSWSPTAGDPVNLADAEEEYNPPSDLTVYNPVGPPVVWKRYYGSLRIFRTADYNTDNSYQDLDYGAGWSQAYNVAVYDPFPGQAGPTAVKYIVMADGADVPFTAPSAPTPGSPVVCSVQPGSNVQVQWNASADGFGTFTVTWGDRTTWTTGNMVVGLGYFAVTQIADRNGNAITLHYTPNTPNKFPLLTSISNSVGTTLLTVNRAPGGNNSISNISDCYGRKVFYNVDQVPYDKLKELVLDHVSEVVPACSSAIPDRYVYGFEPVQSFITGYTPFIVLHTITVPSPTGIGSTTATINYDEFSTYVTDTVDGNGNVTKILDTDQSGNVLIIPSNNTTVQEQDNQGHVLFRYTVGFDSNMDQTYETNGSETGVANLTYNDPNDPYKPSSATDAFNHVTYYSYDSFGHVLTRTDARGTLTTQSYSYSSFNLGELVSVKTGSKQATSYGYYEPSGYVSQIIAPAPGTSGGTVNVAKNYHYDRIGNATSISGPGNATSGSITTTFNYTTDGVYSQNEAFHEPLTITDNLGHVSHLRYDSQGNIASATDSLGHQTTVTYNIVNDPVTTTFPATGESGPGNGSSTLNYEYPGGPITSETVLDESGNQVRSTSHSYGLDGEMLAHSGSLQPVSYSYDGLYRIKTITDGNGHTTTYTYNGSNGTVASIAYPDAGSGFDTVSFPNYDAMGDLLKRIDGRGLETDYTYNDPDNLLTKVSYPASANLNVSYGYDSYGRVSGITDGAAAAASGAGIVPEYDDNNEVTSITTTYIGPTTGTYLPAQTISYTYNSDRSRATMVTPAGTFSYGYDGVGRPNALTNPFTESTSWSYLNNGWLSTRSLQNGATTTDTYDSLGQILDADTKNSINAVLTDYSVPAVGGYDGAGNMLSRTDTITGLSSYTGTNGYSYDTKNQLTQETSSRAGGYTNAFAYDSGVVTGAGDPTTFKGVANTFNADNQYTTTGYTYDGEGNPTTYKGTGLTFDPENRMTAYGSVLTCGYLYSGLRAWKQNAAGTRTYFLYDGSQPVCELNATGAVTAVNTFGADGLVSRRVGSTSTFYTFDLQGGNAQRLDASGNVIGSAMFDAYGSRASTDGSADPFSGYGAKWGYYTDSETVVGSQPGIELCTYRFYDPANGRFINRDPAGYDGGVNIYNYVGNNPIGLSDPSGLICPNQILGFAILGLLTIGVILLAPEVLPFLGDGLLDLAADGAGDAFADGAADGAGDVFGDAAGDGAGDDTVGSSCDDGVNCFIAGTLVHMADGSLKPIEKVVVGEKVESRDPATGKIEIKTVLVKTIHLTRDLVDLQFAGKRHGKEVDQVTCTAGHPFYVVGKGFVTAGNLAVGNSIVTRAGPPVVVIRIVRIHAAKAVPVFNFTIQDDHTYFVGSANGGEWVHNSCKPPSVNDFNLVDNNVPKPDAVAQALRDSGWNARSVGEHFGATNVQDSQIISQLNDTYGTNWNVITRDVNDFSPSQTYPITGGNATQTVQQVMNILQTYGF